MKGRTWPILALGFGALVLMTLVVGLDAWRKASQINQTILAIHDSQARTEEALRKIKDGIYLSSIFIRDFLLDPSQLTADSHRDELRAIRSDMDSTVANLHKSMGGADQNLLNRLHEEIDEYWDSMDPIFDWTPVQKIALSSMFLRRQVLPRRTAVLDMSREVRDINEANLGQLRQEMDRKMAEFGRLGERSLVLVVGLGLIVSLASVIRLSRLESRADRERLRTEKAERELRLLSNKLVRAQEDERRNISRELHDQVGQTLTALRVELGNLERLRSGSEREFQDHLEDAKGLAAETLQTVRNLAAGLRPSMLDDLGLGPALDWQAREFSRRTGIPVEVTRDGGLPELPERHRTCLYRVVQEALTNCARHAGAKEIRIALEAAAGRLLLTVQDDGRGLPGGAKAITGLGLVGLEERVRELGGTLAIESQAGKGAWLCASIPLPAVTEA